MRIRTLPTLGLLYTLLLTGCDGLYQAPGPPDVDIPVTKILRVEQLPNPVMAGDSVTVKVTVRDSLSTRLEYSFSCAPLGVALSRRNTARFKAPSEPGRYYCEISVTDPSNGDPDVVGALAGYDVIVVPKSTPN